MPAVTLEEAIEKKLSLYVSSKKRRWYVLYDVSRLNQLIDNTPPHEIFIADKHSAKFIKAALAVSQRLGLGYDSTVRTVEYSAAVESHGPLLYDIVMSMEGQLTANKTNVTEDARRVWTRYKDVRSQHDVEALPLNSQGSPLDYAYAMRRPLNVDALLRNHEASSEMLSSRNVDLDFCAETFFSALYF